MQDLSGLDAHIKGLPLGTTEGLMDHNASASDASPLGKSAPISRPRCAAMRREFGRLFPGYTEAFGGGGDATAKVFDSQAYLS